MWVLQGDVDYVLILQKGGEKALLIFYTIYTTNLQLTLFNAKCQRNFQNTCYLGKIALYSSSEKYQRIYFSCLLICLIIIMVKVEKVMMIIMEMTMVMMIVEEEENVMNC